MEDIRFHLAFGFFEYRGWAHKFRRPFFAGAKKSGKPLIREAPFPELYSYPWERIVLPGNLSLVGPGAIGRRVSNDTSLPPFRLS